MTDNGSERYAGDARSKARQLYRGLSRVSKLLLLAFSLGLTSLLPFAARKLWLLENDVVHSTVEAAMPGAIIGCKIGRKLDSSMDPDSIASCISSWIDSTRLREVKENRMDPIQATAFLAATLAAKDFPEAASWLVTAFIAGLFGLTLTTIAQSIVFPPNTGLRRFYLDHPPALGEIGCEYHNSAQEQQQRWLHNLVTESVQVDYDGLLRIRAALYCRRR